MADNRLRKTERLKSRHEIKRLFSKDSQSVNQYPFKLVWKLMDTQRSEYPIQLAISVPKRRFKHAVDRNAIKRLIRESYRLQKADLYQALEQANAQQQMAWMIIYIGKEKPNFHGLSKAMQKLITKFLQRYKKS